MVASADTSLGLVVPNGQAKAVNDEATDASDASIKLANGSGYGGVIDPEEHLSKLSKGRKPNELRSLAPMIKLPGIKWLAGGLPSPLNFPITSISFTLSSGQTVVIDDPKLISESQQYCLDSYGPTRLRHWVEKHVKQQHDPPNQEWAVCMTCGNSDAIDKVMELLLGPGDAVLVEEVNFIAASCYLATLPLKGIEVVGMTVSSRGLTADEVERSYLAAAAKGRAPKALYTIPTGQNPTGISIDLEEKRKIYRLAQKYNLIIIEDDAYYYLQFPAAQTCSEWALEDMPGLSKLGPSFLSMDTDCRVVRMDTASKFIGPGFRTGWLVGHKRFMERVAQHAMVSSQGVSSMSGIMIEKMLEAWGHEGFEQHIRVLQLNYCRRAELICRALEDHMVRRPTCIELRTGT